MNDRMRTAVARKLKALLIESSPVIEGYTRQVCPGCVDVCCRQRHGMFTGVDRSYLDALGEPVPSHDDAHALDGPCQFLGPDGCDKPRWQRAWKCTWYFCDPLLRAIAEGPQKQARALSTLHGEILRLYDQLDGGSDD